MKQFWRVFSIVLSISAIGLSLWGITHRQDIYDWMALKDYEPPARIAELADKTTMKPESRKVFYVYHPALNDKSSFKKNCPAHQHSIVLGCYVNTGGIFLLDVTDERLAGVIEVTAAHELLHAEYDRMSDKERQRVDAMTSKFFASLDNARIKKTVEEYRDRDAGVVPNELHSILATEVRNLSPDLESYYSQYFNDRKQIVAFSEKYEQTFVNLKNQVDNYDQQLTDLKSRIESSQARLSEEGAALQSEKNRLDSLISSGQTERYNAAVPGYNAQVGRYNSLISSTRDMIDRYNSLVEQRNAIATTEQELIEAINSNAVPQEAR